MTFFKKAFVVATIVMACSPAFVSAQDFFFSFDEFSRMPTDTATFSEIGDTGSLYIFSDVDFGFNQLDLDFFNSDSNVVAFTGGTGFNSTGAFVGVDIFLDENDPITGPTATANRLSAVALIGPGLINGDTSSPDFRPGANGFLLGQVDFEIVGPGTANFDFAPGDFGIFAFLSQLDPSFGSGSFTVEDAANVPEPSSAVLLILGGAAVAARRRRV